eukprot:9472457-Pyramimonas_sp.AAC.1
MPPKKSKAKKGKNTNPLLEFDNRFCVDCEQWTHDADRDGDGKFLEWHKRNNTKKGTSLAGDERYDCYKTRRRVHGTKVTLAEAREL